MMTPKSKAETLNQQFHSVFTKEDDNIPYIIPSNHPSIDNLTCSVNGIQKLLQSSNMEKLLLQTIYLLYTLGSVKHVQLK